MRPNMVKKAPGNSEGHAFKHHSHRQPYWWRHTSHCRRGLSSLL